MHTLSYDQGRTKRTRRKKSRKKPPLREKLSALLELPPDTLGGMTSLSLCGNRTLIADGCRSVLSYSDSLVTLRMCDQTVTLHGKNLRLAAFRGDRITVRGQLLSLELEEARA